MPERKSILIIDDEMQLRRSLSLILSHSDYQVACAATAREGLQLLQAGSYDLLFLDVKLPDGNGINLLPSILQIAPSMPVLILTAHADPTTATDVARLGAWAYLLKPIDPEDILARVADALSTGKDKHPTPLTP